MIDVHIGYGKTDGKENSWHPRVASKLMAVLWVFQDRLDTLHPVRRRTNKVGSNHCPSLWTMSKLAYQLRDDADWKQNGLERLLGLREENECDEIVKMAGARDNLHMRLGYNIDNLSRSISECKTFEFRQHCGTLSPDRITAWVNVCAGLVEFADTVEDELLEPFLRSHVNDELEDYTVIDLLRAIGRPGEAEFYDQRIREYDQDYAPEDFEVKELPPRRPSKLDFYDKRALDPPPSPKLVERWGPNGIEYIYE